MHTTTGLASLKTRFYKRSQVGKVVTKSLKSPEAKKGKGGTRKGLYAQEAAVAAAVGALREADSDEESEDDADIVSVMSVICVTVVCQGVMPGQCCSVRFPAGFMNGKPLPCRADGTHHTFLSLAGPPC